MPHIYLRHPIHGTKIATMDLEAEADEQNGWKRFNPNAQTPVAVDTPTNELETRRRRRQPETKSEEEN